MELIDITNHDEKINRFYTIYKKYFPKLERDTLKNIKTLAHTFSSVPNWYYNIVEIIDKEEIIGGVIYNRYSDINVLIIEYIFIIEAYRHKEIAKQVIGILQNKFQNVSIVVEVEKEGLIKKFWEKNGFSIVLYDYVQPPITKQQSPCNDLMIMCNKTIKNLEKILVEYYWKNSFLYVNN